MENKNKITRNRKKEKTTKDKVLKYLIYTALFALAVFILVTIIFAVGNVGFGNALISFILYAYAMQYTVKMAQRDESRAIERIMLLLTTFIYLVLIWNAAYNPSGF